VRKGRIDLTCRLPKARTNGSRKEKGRGKRKSSGGKNRFGRLKRPNRKRPVRSALAIVEC